MLLWREDATNKDCWYKFAIANRDSESIEDKDLSEIQNIIKEKNVKSVLEIGCGVGLYAKSWINRGFNYTGIDQIKYAIEIAHNKNPNGRFETIDIINYKGSFDIVFSHTVLQHIHKKFKGLFLQKIYELIKNYGFFVVYEDVFEHQPSVDISHTYKKWKTHPYLYSKKEWIEKIESFGFKLYAECGECLLFCKL